MVVILSEDSGASALSRIKTKLGEISGKPAEMSSGTFGGVTFVLVPDASDRAQQEAQKIEGLRAIFPAKDLPQAENLLLRIAAGKGPESPTAVRPNIAFQGAKGAYSQSAVAQFYPDETYQLAPKNQFKDVFEAVQKGECELGVLPMENALTGSIHENYDLLLQYPELGIHGETYVRIRHNLIAIPGTAIDSVKRVFSHPQGLLQSAKFLDEHPDWERVSFFDTAGSVAHIKELKLHENAAIAGASAAEVYGMSIIAEGIETNPHNFTRFCIIAKNDCEALPELSKLEALKASIVFSLPHRPGALLHCMQSISNQDLNLTKIESRPIHGKPWEYMFYLDVDIGTAIDRFHLALHLLRGVTEEIRVLGLYPRS